MTPPLKWHGGKHYLARRIVALMPPHLHYVEPFAGGLAVLLERDPNDRRLWASECSQRGGVSEVVNDLDRGLSNFWTVLRHPAFFPQFLRLCEATPLCRATFDAAAENLKSLPKRPRDLRADCQVWAAWEFFVAARQSLAGRFQGFTSLTRSRTRRGINGNASEWLGAVEGLAAVHARLLPVVVENLDALKLIPREDTPDTLFYCDPPYLSDTRASPDVYRHEMSRAQHIDLLNALALLRGKFLLSGYRNDAYDAAAAAGGWRRRDFDLPNHAAGGGAKRRMTESVWMNYDPPGDADAA